MESAGHARSGSESTTKIQWAPLNISMERRLQTLGMFHLWFCFFLGAIASIIILIVLLLEGYYMIFLTIVAWTYYDLETAEKGGRRSEWFRKSAVFRHQANYFPAKLYKTVDLDPNKSYVFGVHPHGVQSMAGFIHFSSDGSGFSQLFPGLKSHMLTLGCWFYIPLIREYVMMSGSCSVSKRSIDYILSIPGNIACIAVGGAKESLESTGNLYLKGRKGFVKRAIVNGSDLCPVYTFGELDIYNFVPNPSGSKLRNFQVKMTKLLGFAPAFFFGRGFFNYNFGLLPMRRPLNTVVGRPFSVEKCPNPSSELVEKVHQQYIDELQKLYEENKTKFGIPKEKKLIIV